MDFFDEPKPKEVRLTNPKKVDLSSSLKDDNDRLRNVEDKVLGKALTIVQDALHFADLDMGDSKIPDAWVDEVGIDGAERRHRAATWSQLNAKEAPVGLKMAKEVLVGIVKARATEKAEPKRLNIAITKIDFQLPAFPSVAVDR